MSGRTLFILPVPCLLLLYLKWIYETTESQAILPTPPLPPLYSLHPTLWDEWVSQKHNAPLLAHWFWRTHAHTEEWLYHKDNNSKETVKDIFHIIYVVSLWACVCVCVYVRVPVLVLGLLSDTLFLLFFLLLLSFSLSSPRFARLSLSLSLPTYDSEVRKKLSVFYAHTLLQANKPYWSLHKEPKPNVSCLYNSGEVGGVWKKKDYIWGWGLGLRYPCPLLAHKDIQWTLD